MSVQAIQLGEAFVKLTADATELNRGVANATTLLDRFGNLSMQAAKVATAAWATLGATIGATATHFAMVGDQLDKMSLRTGISVKALSELGYVAGQCGASLEDIHDLMWPLAEKIQRNDEELTKWGLSLAALQTLSPEKQFYAVVDALSRLESHSEQAAAATEIFGGAGEKLLPMLKQGVGGIEKLREEARKLGFVMDAEGAAKAAALTDAYDNMNRATLAVSQNIGMVFAPFVTKAAKATAYLCAGVSRFIQESPNITSSLADVAVNLTKLSGGLVVAYGGIAAVRYGWTLASSTLLTLGSHFADLRTALRTTLAYFTTGGRVVEDFRRSMSAAAIASEYLALHQMRNAGALTTNAAALQFMSVAEIQSTIKTKTAAFFRSLFTRTTQAAAVATEELAATLIHASQAETACAAVTQNHQLIILRQNAILQENTRLLAARASVLQLQGPPLQALAKSQSTALVVSHQFQKAETALVPILQASSTALTTNAAANTLTITARQAHTLAITQQTAAQNVQRTSLLKSAGAMAAQKTASLAAAVANGLWSATTWVAAAAAKGLSYALVTLSIAWNTNPIGLAITGLLALGGVLTLVASLFYGGETAATRYAQAMTRAREANDAIRSSGESYAQSLEQLTRKVQLNDKEKEHAKKLIEELEATHRKLGKENETLGITFDEMTGKIEGTEEALAKLRQAMRESEAEDLQKERDALKAQQDELKKSIRLDGGIGTWRKIGTWASFGYVDNEKEIKQKITDLGKKIGEVTTQQTRVLGYSEVYQEAEKKLEEWYQKDREKSQTALQRKITDIQKEFTERETLLKQLIAEQELRSNLTEKEQEELQQRRTALAGLNDEQQRRITLLKEEENLRLQKMKEEFDQKRADEAEKRTWKEKMENPEQAFQVAQKESQKADAAFREALADRQAANETPEKKSEKDLQLLDEAIEKNRAQAELWQQRLTEADDARNQRERDAQTQYRNFVNQHQTETEETAEQKAWEKQKETDQEGAKRIAETTFRTKEAEFRRELAALDTLLKSKTSTDDQREAQWQKVQELQNSLKKWTGRVEELDVEGMDSRKEDHQNLQTTRTSPTALMAGSAEAQQKILDLRQSRTDPLLARADRTNELLEKNNDLMSEMSGKLEGV